jgi:hypothetical protein
MANATATETVTTIATNYPHPFPSNSFDNLVNPYTFVYNGYLTITFQTGVAFSMACETVCSVQAIKITPP